MKGLDSCFRRNDDLLGFGRNSKVSKWIMRCPRLGGEVPFSYCEREAGDLPCRQVVHCGEAGFPVEEYLRETLTPEAWERLCGQTPKDRMTTILDIALTVRQRR